MRVPIRSVAFMVSLSLSLGCGADGLSDPRKLPETPREFRANLDGASVVPPHTSSATGSAFVAFENAVGGSEDEYRFFYSFQISGLNATTYVLLRRGAPGQNGEVLYTFCGLLQYQACHAGPRLEMAGMVEPTQVRGFGADMDRIRESIEAGQAYIEVQTKAHRSGELRGQLQPE